jgi:predicted kinase
MRQAHLILITGLPGTGKSTVARALASRYELPLLAKDSVKEPLLDAIGARDRAESRRLSDASFAVMFALARDCLSAGTDLILEGNFRPGEHEPALEALIPGSARQGDLIRIAQILCRSSESVRIARLLARATDPTRHPGHRDAELAIRESPAESPELHAPGGTCASVSATHAPNTESDAPLAREGAHAMHAAPGFLALPGERLVFDSEARSAAEVDLTRLRVLLDTLDHWLLGHTSGRAS